MKCDEILLHIRRKEKLGDFAAWREEIRRNLEDEKFRI